MLLRSKSLPHTDIPSDSSSPAIKLLLLSCYAVLTIARSPWVFTHGHVWGEEGTVYLQSAWSMSWLGALVAPHQGYLSLWPNLCGLLVAKVFPLAFAAVVLPSCALLVQIATGWFVVESESFVGTSSKVGALAITLLTSEYEVWLNTINSQFYLVLCVAVLLVSRDDRLFIPRGALLLFSALTGPMSVALLPLFALRAWLERSRGRWSQTALLFAGAAVQVGVVVRQVAQGTTRTVSFQPSGIAPMYLVRYLIRPFLGRLGESGAAALFLNQPNSFWAAHLHRHMPLTASTIFLEGVLNVVLLVLVVWLTRDTAGHAAWWLLAASWSLALLCLYGALGGTYALEERYVYTSAVLMGFALLLGALSRAGKQRFLARGLLAFLLMSGFADFARYKAWAAHQRPIGPDWKEQVQQQTRADVPAFDLLIWPRNWHERAVHLIRKSHDSPKPAS